MKERRQIRLDRSIAVDVVVVVVVVVTRLVLNINDACVITRELHLSTTIDDMILDIV